MTSKVPGISDWFCGSSSVPPSILLLGDKRNWVQFLNKNLCLIAGSKLQRLDRERKEKNQSPCLCTLIHTLLSPSSAPTWKSSHSPFSKLLSPLLWLTESLDHFGIQTVHWASALVRTLLAFYISKWNVWNWMWLTIVVIIVLICLWVGAFKSFGF
jgi:hypothetical protein